MKPLHLTAPGLLVILAATSPLAPLSARADCAAAAAWTYPDAPTPIPTNGRIIINTVAWTEASASALEDSLSLRGGGDIIQLRRLARHLGQKGESQRIYFPVRHLLPATSYALDLPAKPDFTKSTFKLDGKYSCSDDPVYMQNCSDGFNALAALRWNTGEGPDTIKLIWQAAPTFEGVFSTRHGCGPDEVAFFSLAVGDNCPGMLVLATVTDLRGKPVPRSYVLPIEPSGSVRIGHGMCSGPFTWTKNHDYRVVIEAYDLAGNQTIAPGPPSTIRWTPKTNP